MIALLDNLGTVELMIVAIAGLLVFGRRLPEVASQAGATLAKFRRGLDGAIHDSGVEREIRKIREALPTDVSVPDLARAAARKLEDRIRERVEAETLVDTAPPTAAAPALDAPAPSTEADPAPPPTPPAAANSAKPGVDPASRFGAPGSVPRA